MNNKIRIFEINSSIGIFYIYSTIKYLEISGIAWSPYLRLRSAALRAMDDDEGVDDRGERYGTSGRSPSPATDTRCCVRVCV